MAIIPTTQNKVALYAAGLYGMKLGSTTNSAVLADVQLNTANGKSGLDAVLNAYYAPFASKTSAEVAAIVVANAGIKAGQYGLTAQNVADAVASVTAALNAAAPLGQQGKAIADVLTSFSNDFENNTVYGEAAKAWNVKISQSVAYSNSSATADIAFGDIVTEFRLSSGGENRTGTAGNDTFIAVQGTFDNADRVNGGDGFDTLKAQVSGVVAPNVSNVEHLQFQAQHRGVDSGDNNVADEQIVKVDFNTNVTNVTGFTTIENSNSRADLIVEDVRISNAQITKDITIIMRETDPGNVDYGVYFDQNSLRSVSNSSSQINLQVMDTRAVVDGKAPLLNSPYGGFVFTATDASGKAQVITLESAEIDAAQTYAELAAAFQKAADAKFGAGVVTATIGSNFTVTDTTTGTRVTGQEIVLKTNGAYTFSTPAGSGWKANGVVPANSGLHTDYNQNNTTSTELVTSNIILDDVGRGSTGGDLVVGGLSVGETSTSKGVQKFLIEVQDNSKLQTINSTNNTLREVVIKNGVTTRVDNAYNENQKDAGALTVNGKEADESSAGNVGGTNNNTPLPGSADQHNKYGFSDVRVIDGSAMTGKLAFTAEVTGASLNKYLTLTDGKPANAPTQPGADNADFVYSGGQNDDTIAVTLDAGVTAQSKLLTGREDFTFSLNGGAGNDALTLNVIANSQTSANWYANQKTLKNLSIDAGAGNDTIKTPGWGDVKITAGTGDDTVYVDNSGNKATWAIASTTNVNDPLASAAKGFLFDGKVTVSFTGAAVGGGVTAGAADSVAAAFTNGFEVVANVPTGANYTVTQYHINQAIKAAINGDAVLSKLLVAKDGPASSLVIESLIDGAFTANDIQITVSSADLTAATTAVQSTALAAYKLYAQDSSATIAAAQTANAATVTAANDIAGMDDNQQLASSGTGSVTVALVTDGAAAVVAAPAAAEVATFTVSQLLAGESITINGLTVTATGGIATVADVESLLEGGVAGTAGFAVATGANNAAAWTIGAGAVGAVEYTSVATANVTDLTVTGTAGRGTISTVQGTTAVTAAPATTEVFNATFKSMIAGETVTFDGQTYTAATAKTAAEVAAGFVALGGAFTTYNAAATTPASDTVVFTAKAAGTKTNATAADFVYGGTVSSTGSISTAESDNTIDLGAGNDVAVLGTGANSKDTVVFTGYDLGKNTIVNFEDTTVASRDLLDFNAYLTGKSSASGSVESQKHIAIALNTDTAVEANSVTVLNSAVFTTTDTFAGLTAAKLLAAVNSNGTAYAGLTSSTLDAVTSYTANTLVGGVGKAVVLVENNANQGEYLAFELSFAATATNTTKDFTDAKLIGTVDFGHSVNFANVLVA